jgi:CBS domain containing-hemolysin-like protein
MEYLSLIFEALFLVAMSAVCSGLNLSLMSLDLNDLSRKAKAGDARAKKVLPLRKNSHLSLASILLSNVAVVSATSLLLEHRFGGLIAGAASTLMIVIFGEIIPQALFVKSALSITASLAPILRLLIIITYPVSKPLQLLLDKLFGEHSTRLHTRHELGLIIMEHDADESDTELDDHEVDIIKGALGLSDKRVRQITTPIKDVYWLTPDTVIDAARIDEIKSENYSRIPIFNKQLTDTHGILLMKQLVDIDFDERSYLVSELPLVQTQLVGNMTALDTMFKKFIGARTHLMPVEKDDRIIGIVTIEDLIEEIVGHEIEDETDTHA